MALSEFWSRKRHQIPTITNGLWAGLLGGFAEVVWISVFSKLAGGDAIRVADGITATVAPALAGSPAALPLGIAVHFGLAALLGVAVVLALRAVVPALIGTWRGAALVVLALAGIWAVNFLVILPLVNPGFVTLVPLWASFTSKLLFGLFAAVALAVRPNPDERREI